jgi:predicted solute-binding protein
MRLAATALRAVSGSEIEAASTCRVLMVFASSISDSLKRRPKADVAAARPVLSVFVGARPR